MPDITLTEEQKAKVRSWLEQGIKLSELQSRLASEFGIRATYMDVKLLISDLQVLPKDPESPAQEQTKAARESAAKAAAEPAKPAQQESAGRVSINVDDFARPGAIVSGSVTFSDGKKAIWYIDEFGRIGVSPSEPGYRPSEADMQEFQILLEQELTRQGY